jgi:hypothetical protein
MDIGTSVKWEVMLPIPYMHSALAKPTQVPLLGYREKKYRKTVILLGKKQMFK